MARSAIAQLDGLEAGFTSTLQAQGAGFAQRIDALFGQTAAQRAEVAQLTEMVNRLTQENALLGRRFDAARKEIMFQQRRLNRSLESHAVAEPAVAPLLSSQALDAYYVAFEDQFRGPRDDVKRRQAPYVERLKLAGVGSTDKPVLDVGCGRGEWLELLKENQLSAYGIDINSVMVEQSKSLGLDARCTDLLSHLRSLPDASLSAVTAFHIVEHLPFEVLVAFIDEALRVLDSGGLLLFETPNPETVMVGASTFYNDPTHRNPIPPHPLQFMVTQRGFIDAEIIRLHPFGESSRLQGDDINTMKLNEILFGPQDYAVIARSA